MKSGNNSASHTNEEFYTKNKNAKKRIIKVIIAYNKQLQTLEEKINNETYKNNENDLVEIEVYDTETIGNLIKKYCDIKKIKDNNLYIMKKDLKKIENDLTLNQAKIINNETIFLFNKFANENDDKSDEINFIINYQNQKYSISGWKNDTFSECMQSFIEDKKGKSFLFIYKDNIIDKNKTIDELNIKNGDEIKVGEFK